MASEALLSTFQDGERKDYDAPRQTPTAVNKSLNALLWLGRRVTSQVSQIAEESKGQNEPVLIYFC